MAERNEQVATCKTSNRRTNLQVEVNDVFLLMFLIARSRENAEIQITENQLNFSVF